MPQLTPSNIVEWVRKEHLRTLPQRQRMDADYDLWRLVRYNTNPDGGDAYKSYTSPAPRSFADKIVSAAASAKFFAQVRYDTTLPDEEKRRYDDKERFIYGVLKAMDDLLGRRLELSFQTQAAWFLALRGSCMVRTLLVRDESGTRIDVRFWDPRNTYLHIGSQGLTWACYRTERQVSDVQEDYGLVVPYHSPEDRIEVYDYFDPQVNAVLIEGAWLKPPTLHAGSATRRVPVAIGVSGNLPLLVQQRLGNAADTQENSSRDYADSIFAGIRGVYPQWNEILSIYLDNVDRGREQSYVLTSHTGEKPTEGNVNKPGSEIQLQVGETYKPIEVPQIAQATAQLAQLVSGEFQRASLPFSSYGDPPYGVSGVALNLLNQSNMTVLLPVLRGMNQLTGQVMEILLDQYSTNAFDDLRLDGLHKGRHYFNLTITPDRIRDLPRPDIRFVPELPQDDAMALQFAQAARQGPIPLLSDLYLWENKLGVQDAAGLADEINTQLAQRVSPAALDFTLMRAADRQGEQQVAMIYYLDMAAKLIMAHMQLTMLQGQGGLPQNLAGQKGGAAVEPPPPETPPPPGSNPGLPATEPPPLDARKVQYRPTEGA